MSNIENRYNIECGDSELSTYYVGGNKMLTTEELKSKLHYNPKTGIFTWIGSTGSRAQNGTTLISVNHSGYIMVRLFKKHYRAHRLAWLYTYGEFPEGGIDHINQNKADNRICNLRDVDKQTNQRNTRLSKNNTSGKMGVTWNKRKNKWLTRIKVNYKDVFLGYFIELSDAIIAREEAELKYNFSKNHGKEYE